MLGSSCGGSSEAERCKGGVVAAVAPLEKCDIATEQNAQKAGCGCEPSHTSEGGAVKQLPIVWQRLVRVDGRTCPRCDATSQHLQSAVSKLREVLKPLNVEPILNFGKSAKARFRNKPSSSNRIWIAGKPLEQWLGASIGSSTCCSVCGDAPCRTMEVEGTVFEDIPEAVIVKAALVAAAGLLAQTP